MRHAQTCTIVALLLPSQSSTHGQVANTEKIPVLAVVGKREVESSTLKLAHRKGGGMGPLSIMDAVRHLADAQGRSVEPFSGIQDRQ